MSYKYKVLLAVSVVLFLTTSVCAVQTVKKQRNDSNVSYQLIKDTCEFELTNAHFVDVLGNIYAVYELDNCLSHKHLVMLVWPMETSPRKVLIAEAIVSELNYERNNAKKENLTYALIKTDKDTMSPPEGMTSEAMDIHIMIYSLEESK